MITVIQTHDRRWIAKYLRILRRDGVTCANCAARPTDRPSRFYAHHRYHLKDRDPWEYPNVALVTLCESCHNAQWDTIRPSDKAHEGENALDDDREP